jgi:hypothetical protein
VADHSDKVSVQDRTSDIVQLAAAPDDKRSARAVLFRRLAWETSAWTSVHIVDGLMRLDPADADKRQARQALLRSLGRAMLSSDQAFLARELIQLDPTADDRRQALGELLKILAENDPGEQSRDVYYLTTYLVEPCAAAEDKRHAREALLRIIDRGSLFSAELASAVIRLSPAAQDKRHARETLLHWLASQTHAEPFDPHTTRALAAGTDWQAMSRGAVVIAHGLQSLDASAHDKSQAREALFGWLANPAFKEVIATLAEAITALDPHGQRTAAGGLGTAEPAGRPDRPGAGGRTGGHADQDRGHGRGEGAGPYAAAAAASRPGLVAGGKAGRPASRARRHGWGTASGPSGGAAAADRRVGLVAG